MRLLIALLLHFASPSFGQTVRVTSGEHDGFTRLVFDYGQSVDWQVGRSLDGYELQLTDMVRTYDLSNAFKLIGKSRLAAIWAAPDSGNLHIGLACACHVIPFEFRPGIIVVDLKDGAPPEGSSFELALDGAKAAPLEETAPIRPKSRSSSAPPPAASQTESVGAYDWTAEAYSAIKYPNKPTAQGVALETKPEVTLANPSLQPLRDSLVEQMARGASQGVVDMTGPSDVDMVPTNGAFPSAQIRIGEGQSSVNRPDRSVNGALGAQGANCTPAEHLNIAAWGDEAIPLTDQIAASRTGLSGEFDKPDPSAIARSVQFQLFIGFGAEARQTLRAFDQDYAESAAWTAVAFLIDSEADPSSHFAGQAACDGPAALWSVLSAEDMTVGDAVNTGAVRLAFSALPLHLRQQIGPALIEKFLALQDQSTALALRDSIRRAPGEAKEAMILAEADMDLSQGSAANAEEKANVILADPGPSHVEALIALTEARVAQSLPVEPEVALALEANLTELSGTDIEPKLVEATILAQAASGNFAAAFASLANQPNRQQEVWKLLASLAEDEVFLTHAVLDPVQDLPNIADETAAAIARRLTGLGLPMPAQKWLGKVDSADPLLVAETALKASDALTALSSLGEAQGEVAASLKLSALERLGQEQERAEILAAAGNIPEAMSAQARAGDWDALANATEGPWKTLAEKLPETPPQTAAKDGMPYGPLARGHDLATAGANTRSAIETLLMAVPMPAPAPLPDNSLTN